MEINGSSDNPYFGLSDRWFDPHCVQNCIDVSDMKDKCAI